MREGSPVVIPTDDRLLITPTEAARLMSVSRSSMYLWLESGKVPGRRVIQGTIRVHLPTLREWLENGAGANAGANPADVRSS